MRNLLTPLFTVAMFCLMLIVVIASCKKENAATQPEPVAPLPVVTNVQPKNPAPGDVVTITGANFGTTLTDVKVTISTQVITITSVSATEIKFTLPTGISAGDIAVAIKGILANNTDPQKATITPQTPAGAATIVSINPTSGRVGDVVTITGTNFGLNATDNVVKFNGVTATITGTTGTVLTVTVPATATTGAVTLSVKTAASITGPTFTVNTGTGGGTGTSVPYFITLGGAATFSKIATAPSEIGAMVVDKVNNVLYYSDYATTVPTHAGTIYKLKLDGSAPVVLTTDTKIAKIVNMATDAAGNVFAVASLDNLGGVQANIYKIDASTSAITTIGTNVNYAASGSTLNADSQGGLWLGYGQKLNSTTNTFDRNSSFPYGSLSNAIFQGDNIYVDDLNKLPNNNFAFYKYNLLTKVGAVTDFTLQGLFKQDYAAIGSLPGYDSQAKYALDNSENFYAILPVASDASTAYQDSYLIRKTKNGTGGTSTLLSKFYTKPYSVASPVMYTQPRLNTGILFQADATGNLYIKANGTDIVKIVQ